MKRQRYRLGRTLPSEDLSLFCTEMGMLLQSGMAIGDGIAAHIRAQSGTLPEKGSKPRNIFEMLYAGILDDYSLSQSMKNTGVFPEDFISMIRIGEESGSLDAVMAQMAAHYQRDSEVTGEIRSAMVYPLLTLCMMAVILQVLTSRVFPVFTSIYESLGSGLTGAAAASIAVGNGCAAVLMALAVLLLGIAVIVSILGRFSAGQRLLARIKNRLPFSRKISRQLSSARVADSLAMMLDAGYDAEESLDKIALAVTDSRIRKKLQNCRRLLRDGDGQGAPVPLAEALCGTGLWNETECQMIRSGVRFGGLDGVLRHIAQTGMDGAEENVTHAVSLIEPIMIAITAVLIGSILLSVMLPLSGIMAAIG